MKTKQLMNLAAKGTNSEKYFDHIICKVENANSGGQ